MKDNIKTSGTCQCCFGPFAIRKGQRLVLHGYQRPGVGYTIGQCRGYNSLPYELDCEVTKKWRLEVIEVIVPSLKGSIENVKNATRLFTEITDYFAPRVYGKYAKKTITFIKGEDNTDAERSTGLTFEYLQTQKVRSLESDVEHFEKLVTRLERLIRDWVYAPEKLVKEERKQQLLHASRGGNQAWAAACRNSYRMGRGNGPLVTQNPEKVTCPKCKVYAERQRLIAESKQGLGDIKSIAVRG